MKQVSFAALFVITAVSAAAVLAAEPWKLDANANLATALNSYSDNWTGGEAGSFAWAAQFLGAAQRQMSAVLNSKATLKLQFGQTKIQNRTSKVWSAPEKSSDLIDLEELLRFTLGAWVDPFASARVVSQFLDGSDSGLARYANPLEITEALGVSRTLRKSALVDWSARIGGAARHLVDRDKLDAASGGRKTHVTNDAGAEINMDLKASNKENWVTLLSTLRVFEALVSSEAVEAKGTPAENDWRYPHVKWENTLTLTFAKYLMLNLTAYAYYDKDIDDAARLKETLSVGLTWLYARK